MASPLILSKSLKVSEARFNMRDAKGTFFIGSVSQWAQGSKASLLRDDRK
jgi:hypothetical protein